MGDFQLIGQKRSYLIFSPLYVIKRKCSSSAISNYSLRWLAEATRGVLTFKKWSLLAGLPFANFLSPWLPRPVILPIKPRKVKSNWINSSVQHYIKEAAQITITQPQFSCYPRKLYMFFHSRPFPSFLQNEQRESRKARTSFRWTNKQKGCKMFFFSVYPVSKEKEI